MILVEKINAKEALSVEDELKKRSIVIDLETETATAEKALAVDKTPVSKPVVRVNTLEEALALSPQYDSQFVSDIKQRYGAKERERKRLVEAEKIRYKIHAENREEWENSLEQRLRKQLEIVPKAVLDERVELPVVLPEITTDMEKIIQDAMKPHPESQVLCDVFNLTITRRDIHSLSGLNWLNDQVRLVSYAPAYAAILYSIML